MTTTIYWDPFDADIDADPYAAWRRLRDEAPVYFNEQYGFWALSRYDDVEAAHRDPATFSSKYGTVLELMGDQPTSAGMMIFMDPPEHTQRRLLVSRAFTPRRINALEPHIRDFCRSLLADWRPGRPFDLVESFGAQLPSLVITELLGVDLVDRTVVKDWIDELFHVEPGVGMVNDQSFMAGVQLHEYLAAQLAHRRAEPRDDLLTALVHAQVETSDGSVETLSDDDAAWFAVLLITAGTETVGRLIGWAAVVLEDHPAQRLRLAGNPGLMPNAVEELLRYEAPSPVQGRFTTADVTRHGVTIPARSKVLLLTGSAGRDERRDADPDTFDIDRRFDRHVSFGSGIHFCLGAALARLEGRIAIEELLRKNPDWKLDRSGAVRVHTSTVRGWSKLPLAV